jgi:lysophospholipase L1-like esterase
VSDPRDSRLFRLVPPDRILRAAGWGLVVASLVLLSGPVQVLLFSADGEALEAPLSRLFEWLRLALGILGLGLAGLSGRSRVVTRLPSARAGDLVLLAGAALLAFGAVEVWLRVRGAQEWGSALRTPLGLNDIRLDREAALRPGVFAQRIVSDYDTDLRRLAYYTINRYGLRGTLPASLKAPGVSRLVCLGGSTTFGYTVTDGEEWPARLGERLGDRFEVVNAGRPGATTFADFAYLRDRLLQLEPDIVVIYEGFNDLWRGVRRHAGEQPDYGRVDEGMPPATEPLDRGEPVAWPVRLSFLTYHGAIWLTSKLPREPRGWPEPPVGRGRFRFDPAVVSIYEHNLRAIIRLCRRRGVRAVVATFAACDDPRLSLPEQERRLRYVTTRIPQLDVQSGQEGMDLYREITRRVAHEEAAPLVDLARTMTKDLKAYTDTIHFTPEGERLLAERLLEGLRAEALGGAQAAPPGAGS